MAEQFQIVDCRGKVMYTNLARDERIPGYSWRWRGTPGFLTDDQIQREHWTVEPMEDSWTSTRGNS